MRITVPAPPRSEERPGWVCPKEVGFLLLSGLPLGEGAVEALLDRLERGR